MVFIASKLVLLSIFRFFFLLLFVLVLFDAFYLLILTFILLSLFFSNFKTPCKPFFHRYCYCLTCIFLYLCFPLEYFHPKRHSVLFFLLILTSILLSLFPMFMLFPYFLYHVLLVNYSNVF